MSEENRIYWDQIKQPPSSNMKAIGAGRLKGMSSIDPMWRIMAMTEVFGPCGIGWKYKIVNHWESETFDPKIQKLEKSVHIETLLFYKHKGEWSEGIPGLGGSMLLAQEKSGPHHSDEAFKMALTDSLSVAMKSIGMAADVYMGKFDGSKYDNREDLIKEPEGIEPFQVEELRRWVAAFKAAGERESVEFINCNLAHWTKDVAQLWIDKYSKESKGFKTW